MYKLIINTVSTLSRLKAAGKKEKEYDNLYNVSTLSRLKAAGISATKNGWEKSFQHSAA